MQSLLLRRGKDQIERSIQKFIRILKSLFMTVICLRTFVCLFVNANVGLGGGGKKLNVFFYLPCLCKNILKCCF